MFLYEVFVIGFILYEHDLVGFFEMVGYVDDFLLSLFDFGVMDLVDVFGELVDGFGGAPKKTPTIKPITTPHSYTLQQNKTKRVTASP